VNRLVRFNMQQAMIFVDMYCIVVPQSFVVGCQCSTAVLPALGVVNLEYLLSSFRTEVASDAVCSCALLAGRPWHRQASVSSLLGATPHRISFLLMSDAVNERANGAIHLDTYICLMHEEGRLVGPSQRDDSSERQDG
jgi:hypothetical protein